MNYFVIGPDGSKYGPADMATLNAWAAEGRVVPQTMLEDAATGQQAMASAIPGIVFPMGMQQPMGGPQPGPYQQPGGYQQPGPMGGPQQPQFGNAYQRPTGVGYGYDPKELTKAWVMGAVGFICCPVIFSVWGIIIANREKEKGNPQAQNALIFCIVSLVVGVLGGIALRLRS